jgi:Protein of unknown function (DUF3606)
MKVPSSFNRAIRHWSYRSVARCLSVSSMPFSYGKTEGGFMPDDKTKRGQQDRNKININEDYEVRYWSSRFRVTPDQLRAAVQKVGNSPDAVERELKRAA